MLKQMDNKERLLEVGNWTHIVRKALKRREFELVDEGRFDAAVELGELSVGVQDSAIRTLRMVVNA